MKNVISSPFSVTAQKEAVSVDHIDNYYLREASGTTPSVNDSRWTSVPSGGTVPVPTSALPFLWHKYITYLTDGSHYDPIIEFKSSLGQNGIDYDLVPSHSSIIKHENNTVDPANVTCAMVKRNADGSAENLSSIPSGYSIVAYRDNTSSNYTLGSNVSTSGVSVITFVLKYGNVEVERHDIHVITEGAQGLNGRGIQSQDVRFKALAPKANGSAPDTPSTPTNNTQWNEWKTLANANYSATNCYLYKCVKTVYVDGNNNTTTEYYVEGPSVWGQDGKTPFVVDIDNEITAIPVNSEGKVVSAKTLSFGLKAFYGTENVISSCTVQTVGSLPSGFSANCTTNKAQPSVTIAANTVPSELTEITFRITHTTYGSRDVVFSVAAVKSGGMGEDAVIYQLLPSADEISVGRTADGGYNPSTATLTCGYTKRKGQSEATTVADVSAAFDGYNIYFRRYNRSTGWENYLLYTYWKSHLNNFSVATYSKVEFIICTSTANSVSSPTGIIDRETIPVVADGMNGTSPFIVDLNNEMASVALTSGGSTSAAFSLEIELSAFYGITDVTTGLSSVTASSDNSNISVDTTTTITDKKIKISIAASKAISATNDIIITAVHPSYGTRSVVFTLAGVKAGAGGTAATIQELLPDLTQISFARTSDGSSLTPDSRTVNISIKKTVGASVSTQTISASGLTVRYSTSSMPSSKTAGDNVSSSVTISKTTAASATNLYLAAFNSAGTLVDRETIPIVKDGVKGGTGDTGNGIASVAFARMFTMGFESPSATDSGWKTNQNATDWPTEANLSQTNRYLWQRKTTTYTKSSVSPTVEISLLNQYQNGVCANLLEDTAFRDDNEMDAWEIHVGNTRAHAGVPQKTWAANPFTNVSVGTNEAYQEMLCQKVYDANLKKIKPNTWYTLSFWAAMAENIGFVNTTDENALYNSSSMACIERIDSFWLSKNQSATIRVRGKVASTAVYMRVYCWTLNDGSDNWVNNTYVDFQEINFTDKSFTVTNDQNGPRLFKIRAYCYLMSGSTKTSTQNTSTSTNNRCYLSQLSADRGCKLNSYLYRQGNRQAIAHDNSSPWYVDGEKITAAKYRSDSISGKALHNGTYVGFSNDGHIEWQLTANLTRHSVTFKTHNTFLNGTVDDWLKVLFRMGEKAHWGWVSMVKLEENTIATEWIENSYDRYAADFQHIYVGDWKASTNGTASTYYLYALGVRHCVRARKSATESDMTFFRMKKRTENTGYCSTTQPYADTTNWERADFLKFVAADLMLANEVITDKLTVSKIRGKNDKFVLDENGNVTAQGGTYTQITANQLVVNKGTLNDVQVKGSLRNPFTLVGDSFDTNYNDNVSMLSSDDGWVDAYSIPWDVGQSGRVLRLVNFKWGSSTAEGQASISAQTGKYFYEDGLTKSSLKISREYIELVGYGTPTTFYGWIVVARIDLSTTKRYGHCLKILGFGRVTNTSSGATIDYTTFDGSTMSVTRSSTTGRYTVRFSNNWFAKSTDVRVMVQGYGMVADSSTSPSKATLNSTTRTSFVVDISDDASRNNGNFDFIIFNGADFSSL